MPPIDPNEMLNRQITWPMEPTRILMALGKLDPDLYICLYKAHVEYEKKCSDAKNEMHTAILKCMQKYLKPSEEH